MPRTSRGLGVEGGLSEWGRVARTLQRAGEGLEQLRACRIVSQRVHHAEAAAGHLLPGARAQAAVSKVRCVQRQHANYSWRQRVQRKPPACSASMQDADGSSACSAT